MVCQKEEELYCTSEEVFQNNAHHREEYCHEGASGEGSSQAIHAGMTQGAAQQGITQSTAPPSATQSGMTTAKWVFQVISAAIVLITH